jgi:ABC-2 type transport system ATP-binding protein
MFAIETDALSKDYPTGFWRPRPYRALHDLTLAVERGDIFGFLGPNGAGKSTAIKLLMQLVFPTSGSARILGRPLGDPSVKQRIGFLPENPSFYDYLSAEELLTYFAGLFGIPAGDRRARVAAVLDQVGLGAERRARVRSYSKGMVQRVGIAQALINEPEVVFFDEPMSGLDPIGRREIRQLLLDLRARGTTVFFSSHILSDAEALCSQVAIVAQGRLVATGQVSDLLSEDQHGWEVVVDGLPAAALPPLQTHARSCTLVHDGRHMLEFAAGDPGAVVRLVTEAGGRIVSLHAQRETLEAFFVRRVAAAAVRGAAQP